MDLDRARQPLARRNEGRVLTLPLRSSGIMIGEDPAAGVGGINQLKSHLQVEGEQQQQNGAQHVESELTEVKKDGESAAPNDESGAAAGKNNSADLTAVSSTAVIDPDSAAGAPVAEEDDGDPIDMSFPKDGGWKQIVIYLFSFPIMFPLFITLPDTKNPKSEFFTFGLGNFTAQTLNRIHYIRSRAVSSMIINFFQRLNCIQLHSSVALFG